MLKFKLYNSSNIFKLLIISFAFAILSFNFLSKKERELAKNILQAFSQCIPAKNIAYLKAHKTASTTIQVKKVMPKDSIFIASVREPTELFESLFTYTGFEKITGLSFEVYVMEMPPNCERVHGFLGFNQMTFDFGLPEEELQNKTAVMSLIERADKYFDLVLIFEKFEESLILLRHILCWSIEDVASLKTNARSDTFKSDFNEELNATLRDRLSADYLLYNHFKKKLDRLIAEFGEENMAREKAELKRASQRIIKECNFTFVPNRNLQREYKPASYMVNGIAGNYKNESCRYFMLPEGIFIDEIRKKQKMEVLQKFGLISSLAEFTPEGSVRLDKIAPKNS